MSVFFCKRQMERKKYIMRLLPDDLGGRGQVVALVNGIEYNNPGLGKPDILVELPQGTTVHFRLSKGYGGGSSIVKLNGVSQPLIEEGGYMHYFYKVHTNFSVLMEGSSFPSGVDARAEITEE